MTAQHQELERTAPPSFHPDAFLGDWLATLFIAPLDRLTIEAACSGQGLTFIDGVAHALSQREEGKTLSRILGEGSSIDVERALSERYTALFEGVFGPRSISLCESAYRGSGRLFQAPTTEMEAVLRQLDMGTVEGCPEPADHLSIQLAALAEAIRRDDGTMIATLRLRLLSWLPKVGLLLEDLDPRGFYAAAASLAVAFLSSI
ncbi:molecular chaperone [Rhodospirillum sp. A1_3_36]|uniref:TorD/DmsD family molecular chaperone n=1 Tax=Rhodospirillum sp. A1_3_36 TaxID=3391666 RepID=UPI0039A6623F